MSTLGGRNHWLGPVIGAVLIYSLQERLAGAGFADSSQIILGAVLALTILVVPEGLYVRLRAIWRLALAVFVIALAVQHIAGVFDSILTRFFVALIVVLPFVVVPTRRLTGLGWFRPRAETPRSRPGTASRTSGRFDRQAAR
jgi:branched-chain amino acid transport system permease protein